ncbi:hypothetical protein HKI87_02g11200 [Chloropicon roscoffensis]|uniref:Uncharacterized protein n=1 Tax=Chloropicon roscoffensis TaxID=1461544 RepID=A0AAX4P0A6_9CHLO
MKRKWKAGPGPAKRRKGRDGVGSNGDPAVLSDRPWESPDEDHCETPKVAYEHIAPILDCLGRRLGKKRHDLKLYDPFFCEGTAKKHLESLGFAKVHNEKEDFYEKLRLGEIPEHDVLVTNPPFSGKHCEQTVRFAVRSGKPFALLLPSFVQKKKYFSDIFKAPRGRSPPVAFVVPSQAYRFWAPGRADRGIKGVFTQPVAFGKPLECIWFLCLFDHHKKCLKSWRKNDTGKGGACRLFTDAAELPQTFTKKRGNPRQRAKARKLLAEARG